MTNKRKFRVPYCPNNGCGMPNGAAPPCPVTCPFCGTEYTNFDRVCTNCHKCKTCERVAKKHYKETTSWE